MAQRVRIPHRGQGPSSVTQLPITDSTSREVPTLFPFTIQQISIKVNNIFGKDGNNRKTFPVLSSS
jgi:hypothetical protein